MPFQSGRIGTDARSKSWSVSRSRTHDSKAPRLPSSQERRPRPVAARGVQRTGGRAPGPWSRRRRRDVAPPHATTRPRMDWGPSTPRGMPDPSSRCGRTPIMTAATPAGQFSSRSRPLVAHVDGITRSRGLRCPDSPTTTPFGYQRSCRRPGADASSGGGLVSHMCPPGYAARRLRAAPIAVPGRSGNPARSEATEGRSLGR
jgi:hypothetical protein